jgi:hypothetical protein
MIMNNSYYLAAFIPAIIIILRSLIVCVATLIADYKQPKERKEPATRLVGVQQL